MLINYLNDFLTDQFTALVNRAHKYNLKSRAARDKKIPPKTFGASVEHYQSMLLKDCVKDGHESSSCSTPICTNSEQQPQTPYPSTVVVASNTAPEMDALIADVSQYPSPFSSEEIYSSDDLHILAPRTAPTE